MTIYTAIIQIYHPKYTYPELLWNKTLMQTHLRGQPFPLSKLSCQEIPTAQFAFQ